MSKYKQDLSLDNPELNQSAVQLSEALPSFDEIMNNTDIFDIKKVLSPLQYVAFAHSQQWEGVIQAVDNIYNAMMGRNVVKTYFFPGNDVSGSATLLDHMNREYEVDIAECFAVVKVCYLSNVEYVFSDEQHELYIEFRASKKKIYMILD